LTFSPLSTNVEQVEPIKLGIFLQPLSTFGALEWPFNPSHVTVVDQFELEIYQRNLQHPLPPAFLVYQVELYIKLVNLQQPL